MKKHKEPYIDMKNREIRRERVCNDLGCNVFGRLDHAARLLEQRKFDEARAELIRLVNFLPGNLVVTIGDDDQQQLDWGDEDESEQDMRSEETRREEDGDE